MVVGMQMSTVPYTFRASKSSSSTRVYMLSLYKVMRLVFVCACMVLTALLLLTYSFNYYALVPIPKTELVNNTSPLQMLVQREQAALEELREADCNLLKKINEQSTLELKTMIIAETVVPYADRAKLAEYIAKQLEASEIVTKVQTSAIMTMVNLAPVEASVSKEETGQVGSLRNSAVLALFKRHDDNVHFMMVAVRAEPRLGWKWISAAERNAWNNVLSRALTNKVRAEAQNYLWQSDVDGNQFTDAVLDPPSGVSLDKTHLGVKSLLPPEYESHEI